ncbi:unnamed protein product, partial [Oikopleura dioica]
SRESGPFSGPLSITYLENKRGFFMTTVFLWHLLARGGHYQRHYLEHTDDIKCLALHPDASRCLVATGQCAGNGNGVTRPPHVRLWNYNTLETFHVINAAFDKQVVALAFSRADLGAHLFATDDSSDHVLRVWNISENETSPPEKIQEAKMTKDQVLGITPHPGKSKRLVLYGRNHVIFVSFEKDKIAKKSGVFGNVEKPKFVTTAVYTPSGDLLTGDSNGSIVGWNGNQTNFCISNVHQGGIFSIQIDPEGDIITGGGKDGRIVATSPEGEVLDETSLPDYVGGCRCVVLGRNGTIYVGTTKNAIMKMNFEEEYSTIMQGHFDSLWGLATSKTKKSQFLTACFDGRIVLWDLDYHKPVWTKVYNLAFRCAGIHPSENIAAVGTSKGEWLIIELENGEILHRGADGKKEAISVASFSPDGSFLALGSHDNNIYLYHTLMYSSVPGFRRAGRLHGHSSFISHLDWSDDSKHICSNSGDYEQLIWTAETCKQITQPSTMKHTPWATSNCTIGVNNIGIWPEGADGTDINSTSRSNNGNVLAAADDFGHVRVFEYPARQAQAPSREYREGGHSSHVTAVAFTADDKHLLSTGGMDASILQWTVVPK